MVKIKEIRKLGSEIKEIKKKVESIDDEFEEDESEDFVQHNFVRRRNVTSTLETSDIPQTVEERQARVSKEDSEEINFRPSYTGAGNAYQGNNYKPAGSAESSGNTNGGLGERGLERERNLRSNEPMAQEQIRGEVRTEGSYVGEQDRKRERRNLM